GVESEVEHLEELFARRRVRGRPQRAIHAQADALTRLPTFQEKTPHVAVGHDADETIGPVDDERDLDATRLKPVDRLQYRLFIEHAHLPELRVHGVHGAHDTASVRDALNIATISCNAWMTVARG